MSVTKNEYLPAREERFKVMWEVLEILLPGELLALDLAAGPGAVSKRLPERFPTARAISVELDPITAGSLGQVRGPSRQASGGGVSGARVRTDRD
jgi:hypothetical protein